MKAVYGLYADARDVQRAFHGLLAAGLPESQIIVISSEPLEEYEFSHRDKATWMFWIAAAGGAIGLLIATWLTRMTELAWPLPTGNMPIVAWWPNLIIMFELTMLGSILATVITLLVTARLPRRGVTLYDAAVSDGRILVGVENPQDAAVAAIERALASAGSAQIKRV
jgi:ActD protein